MFVHQNELGMYEVFFTEEGNFTKVVVSGERKLHQDIDGAMAWFKIAQYCDDHQTKKLLVVSKLTGSISQMSSYDVSRSLEQFGVKRHIKIAFVDSLNESFNANSFSVKFTKKNGYDIELFAEETNAISWLIQ